ncbi:MAG: NAD(P)/FAD-dependent oxidoreductase [Chloroflexi bacterium]|nr:NAD(P)/FAD-dependent oxidoreductase [Chloroflexota bacterium]
MNSVGEPERIETVIIGGGQAGLSVGYHLSKIGRPFVILDASDRVGDSWRNRWNSLRLFSPARYDGLDGMPFPASSHSFPTKDEMGDYLENYARHFKLPVRNGVRVDCLSKQGDRFIITTGKKTIEAENVVVAMSDYQRSKIPQFASELEPNIVQLHSKDYRDPSQLREGDVLLVGAGNSGADIGMEVARSHRTWISGRDTGHIPFRIEGRIGKMMVPVVVGFLFHRIMTTRTPIGRKIRPAAISKGGPLIRIKPGDLAAAGIKRVPRTVGIKDGKPVLEDGQVLDVANVIWCTGYHSGFSWIDLPVFGAREPEHRRGVVESQPGLFFIGLEFLYALSSSMIRGVGRDSKHIAKAVDARLK